jgi:hypothetical protein
MNQVFLYYFLLNLVVCRAYAGAAGTNDWGLATNDLQMSISLEGGSPALKTGQSVSLLFRYKNVSTNQLFGVYKTLGTVDDSSYSFIVSAPSGKNVSPKRMTEESASGSFIAMDPGQIIEIHFDGARLFKFDEVGTYKITAKKVMWSEAKKQQFELVSNTLEVKVLPNESSGGNP